MINDKIKKIQNDTAGFTFVEMLLVLFIFVILVITASDIFNRTQRAQARAGGLQRLQDDVRYIVTKITNDVRTGGIDYMCYKRPSGALGACGVEIDPVGGNTILALATAQNKKIAYRISQTTGQNECVDDASKPCLLISDNGGTTWQSMTSKGVSVDSAKSRFIIRPTSSPFMINPDSGEYLSNQQPRVMLQFELLSQVKGMNYPAHLPLQTTVTTREYKR